MKTFSFTITITGEVEACTQEELPEGKTFLEEAESHLRLQMSDLDIPFTSNLSQQLEIKENEK